MTHVSAGFTFPVRVYYEDTDVGGVVYYANYLRFMERARTEWLRSLGFDQERLSVDHLVFPVTRTDVRYRKPARLDDELIVTVDPESRSRVSMGLTQRIFKDDALLIHGFVKVACIDTRRWRPVLVPQSIQDAFTDPESSS